LSVIRPIETLYKGYRFRSRLEARWAVFFDAAGIEWKYEPQGFQKIEGEGEDRVVCNYLPDFYLPRSDVWAEVKGSDELLARDIDRLAYMLDGDSALPGVNDSYPLTTGGILLLGEIPAHVWGIIAHPLIQRDGCLIRTWALFQGSPVTGKGEWPIHVCSGASPIQDCMGIPRDLPCHEENPDGPHPFWTIKPIAVSLPRANTHIVRAYDAARGARFEHGESGALVR
jgi:hypothetical protein